MWIGYKYLPLTDVWYTLVNPTLFGTSQGNENWSVDNGELKHLTALPHDESKRHAWFNFGRVSKNQEFGKIVKLQFRRLIHASNRQCVLFLQYLLRFEFVTFFLAPFWYSKTRAFKLDLPKGNRWKP